MQNRSQQQHSLEDNEPWFQSSVENDNIESKLWLFKLSIVNKGKINTFFDRFQKTRSGKAFSKLYLYCNVLGKYCQKIKEAARKGKTECSCSWHYRWLTQINTHATPSFCVPGGYWAWKLKTSTSLALLQLDAASGEMVSPEAAKLQLLLPGF